jgi:RNA-directed DNA polymerase
MKNNLEPEALIWTEGKTDWQHLKRAFHVLSVSNRLAFHEFEGDFGDDQLLKQCAALARVPQAYPNIFIFDRDNAEVVRKVEDSNRSFKAWGNNVYSFAIPIPAHRKDQPAISIEHFFTDDELRTQDELARRLFLSTEFHPKSGRHKTDARLSVGNKVKLPAHEKASWVRILDSEVYDDQSRNVALSKAEFARNVAGGVAPFGTLRFESFNLIVVVIISIVEEAKERIDLPFGNLEDFFLGLEPLYPPQQFAAIVMAAIRACKLTAMTFIASTLRHYEQRILDESSADARKVRPIKQVLAQSFGHPALATIQRLARYCYHLVDEQAPSPIFTLREIMSANPLLGPVGDLLDKLEQIYPPPRDRVRSVEKAKLKKPILDYVLPEFARYEGRMGELAESTSSEALRAEDFTQWRAALLMLLEQFAPIRTLTFRARTIERVHNEQFDVLMTTYQNERSSVEHLTRTYQDLKDDQLKAYELLSPTEENEGPLDLFPFITIKDNKLNYYNRTRARGYEYNVVFGLAASTHFEPTKRKFGHVALRTTTASDKQALFWTQITPTLSDLGIRANIPAHGPIVGRKQQIADIMEQIVEIPNQNGIIYGPGGVGKTALLTEISRQLWEEASSKPIIFENVIWVSAKPNYYDPTLDRVEAQQPQFQSLDNVLAAILEFHEIEDADTYEAEEKKWLVLELLDDERTLLILDNFESISRIGQDEILKFFGVTAKQVLRHKPDYFKVLVTSRQLIASGFHQIKLKGLDQSESKQLMQRLYGPYARSARQQLTDEQMDALYEATQGIPLIIKHCYGQIYEYNRELDVVLKRLSRAGNKVMDFSFAEVFDLLKQDELQLRIILLLELSGRRLMSRQIADILTVEESEVTERLAQLVNFQSANMVSTGTEEKYGINDEVRSLTRRLTLEHATLATEIKRKIAGLAMDKRMDYTQVEFDAVLAFEDYISQGHYVLAENYINERLNESPSSLLLNLHYSKYLKEIKRRPEEAISRLEKILVRSGYDQQVLRLLMTYHIALEIPNFEQAHTYARELEDIAANSKEIKSDLAQFYLAWSTALKQKVELDPIKEMVREQKCKEFADSAIKFLKETASSSFEWNYLLTRGYYNRGDKDLALRHLEKSMTGLPYDSVYYEPYQRLKKDIIQMRNTYFQRRGAPRT